MEEWDWNKNVDISPYQITVGSNKKVWWVGKCGHSWEAQIKSRTHGRGCPICAGKTVLQGVNDIQTTDPYIISEWDYKKNANILPSLVSRNSHTKIWWKCQKGHSWQASPNHRISKGRGCPYCCHNPRVLVGTNDFATNYPELVKEWHTTKNRDLEPRQFTANSSHSVWWKCSKGHEWKCAINHRANGSGCPSCSSAAQTSFPEQAIYYYVKQAYSDAINGFTDMFHNHGMELDIYVPSLNIGIEYDGLAFHRTSKHRLREINKFKICQNNGILLIRIREDSKKCEDICDILILRNNDLSDTIEKLRTYLPKIGNINVQRDEGMIRSMYQSAQRETSLLNLYSKICDEWDYTKNNDLSPSMFSAHSNIKIWWICSKGHEWRASIDSRVRGTSCPYCCNRLVLAGYNDLGTTRPDLIKEWDYEKNSFPPSSITQGSGKKAWWICSTCGNKWQAEISSRNKGHGCPVCALVKRVK